MRRSSLFVCKWFGVDRAPPIAPRAVRACAPKPTPDHPHRLSHLAELAHVPDAYDLVSLMTAREPDLRPSAGEVCKHPFFWNEEKRLSFLLEFSDRLEQVRALRSCGIGRVLTSSSLFMRFAGGGGVDDRDMVRLNGGLLHGW